MGRYKRTRDAAEAWYLATRVRNVTPRELKQLFPEGIIVRERFCGFVKSLLVYHGFSA